MRTVPDSTALVTIVPVRIALALTDLVTTGPGKTDLDSSVLERKERPPKPLRPECGPPDPCATNPAYL